MAISEETIRKITIQGSAQGVAETTDALNKLATAQGNVAVVSDTTSKRSLSAQQAYDKQTLSVVDGARQQVNLAKAVGVATAAYNQGILGEVGSAQAKQALADRTSLLNDKYGQATVASKAFAAATTGVSAQLVALSAGAGPVGVFLSALGPWGLAAAVGLGATEKAMTFASDASHALADKAEELRKFSEATGLTTDQAQALRSEFSKFGVSSEEAQTAIQHFTAQFNQLRVGQGDLLTQIRRVNPALADQMQMTTNAGAALTLFGSALQNVDDIFQRNALVKAAAGRGGLATAQAFTGLNVDQVTQSFVDAGKAIDHEMIEKLAQLNIDIQKMSSQASTNIASIFGIGVLEREKDFAQSYLDLSVAVKNFSLSGDWKQFISDLTNPDVGSSPILTMLNNSTTMQVAARLLSIPGTAMRLAVDGAFAPSPLSQRMAVVPSQFPGLRSTGPADLNDPTRGEQYLRSTGPADLNDPTRSVPNKTIEAQIADLKTLNDALGSAATFAQQYTLAQAELEQKIKLGGAAITDQAADQARAGLALEDATKRQSAFNSALGASATVHDQVTAKLLQIDKLQAQLKGTPSELTDAQATNAKRLAQAQVDGTFALQANIGAMQVQTATIGMSVAAGETYSLIQTKINANLNAGLPAMDGINDRYLKLAAAAGIAKQAQTAAAAQDKANFDLQTIGLSDIDRQIAAVQKSLHGNDWQSWTNDGLSAQLRLVDGMKQFGDMSSTALSGFINDWKNGASAMDAAHNALLNLSNTLVQMATQQLVRAALGGLAGSPSFLSFFGVGSTAGIGAAGQVASSGDALAGQAAFSLRSGGMVGIDGTPTYVHPAYFDNAPRFDAGGMITDDGVPIIAHPGERILNRAETAAYNSGGGGNSGPNITYAPTIDARGADAAAVARLASAMADDRKAFASNVLTVVSKAQGNLVLGR